MNKTCDPRQQLRAQMRQRRSSLTNEQQLRASQLVHNNLLKLPQISSANSVALYLSNDGEVDPVFTIEYCWQENKEVFLPVLDPNEHNQLIFVKYSPSTPMRQNKYNILEPAQPYEKTISAAQLDLVLLPLVAFDDQGNRMGMGGGYYDRSFAFMHPPTAKAPVSKKRPLLIGLAHSCQQTEQLNTQAWDVPLSKIVTDNVIIHTSD